MGKGVVKEAVASNVDIVLRRAGALYLWDGEGLKGLLPGNQVY
jgi:hypothetical protein